MRDFKGWRADIERRAAEFKETLSPERVTADLEMLQGQLVGLMEQTEELVDWFDTQASTMPLNDIIDGMIAFRLKHMSGLDPAARTSTSRQRRTLSLSWTFCSNGTKSLSSISKRCDRK